MSARQFIPTILISALVSVVVSYTVAVRHKPADTIVNPTVVARPTLHGGAASALNVGRAEARAMAITWPGLEQGEIDALTAALKDIPKKDVTVFCQNDTACGDLQMDFENALESAHWTVKTDSLLMDSTVGVAVSSDALRDAINKATSGRMNVVTIQASTPFEAIIIGRKPRA